MDIIVVNSTFVRKVRRYIKSKFSFDAHESVQIAPFGDDSVPPIGLKGLKSKTTTENIHVILGYFNRKQIAEEGEKYFYSLRETGDDSFYIYLKKDGTCEIGGNSDYLVKYNELKTQLDQLKLDFNNLVQKFNTHTQTVVDGVAAIPNLPAAQTTVNFSDIKTSNIKI